VKPEVEEPETSNPSSDVAIETINHLSNVQMLSESTPRNQF
jgi:hypothetical protein